MYRGFAFQSFNGALQRGNAPVIHLVEKDVKGRFIELNNVDTGRLQLAGFLIKDFCELPGQLFTAFIVSIV
ncbi:Uncharacterised protein [Enterobacter cloacae]|nr:Uncharacterised protein [Enterobacter cloacae]